MTVIPCLTRKVESTPFQGPLAVVLKALCYRGHVLLAGMWCVVLFCPGLIAPAHSTSLYRRRPRPVPRSGGRNSS